MWGWQSMSRRGLTVKGRIDYVRIRVVGDIDTRMRNEQYFEELANTLTEKHGLEGKHYDKYTLMDRPTRQYFTNFNVWGELADLFYEELDTSAFKQVSRLDWRVECENEELDLEHVGQIAIKQAKRVGLARSFHDGPIRSKRNGRDTGGPSVIVGGRDSSRRVTIYQRGKQVPAVEIQVMQQLLAETIRDAYERSVVYETAFKNELRACLNAELERICRERLLHPLEAFTVPGYKLTEQVSLSGEDAITVQLDLFMDLLPDTRQRRFIDGRLEKLANSYRIGESEEQPVELDDDWYTEQNDDYSPISEPAEW